MAAPCIGEHSLLRHARSITTAGTLQPSRCTLARPHWPKAPFPSTHTQSRCRPFIPHTSCRSLSDQACCRASPAQSCTKRECG
eukprot:359971-Chlamydomonas_euryale.AAC.1